MTKVRPPGEPWYTALNREPRQLWWAPYIAMIPLLTIVRRLMTGDPWIDNLVIASVVSGTWIVVSGIQRWRRNNRSNVRENLPPYGDPPVR
jgi:hypothetical protein